MRFAVLGLIAMSGMAWAAPDLNEDFATLKEAVAGNDAPKIKEMSATVSKESRAIIAKGDESADVIEFAKGADEYSEYALSIAAVKAADAKTTIEFSELLLAQNNKSKHVDTVAPAYLAALAKEGAAKQSAGAQKILVGRPENEDALYAAASANSANPGAAAGYANKLVAVLQKKAKPEGLADADWAKKKEAMLGGGYYFIGVASCSGQRWKDCDANFKAAEPLVKSSPQMLGVTYFYLGLANYQMAKLTQDKSRVQTALKYSEQAAAIPGPMQGQAGSNVAVMKKELGVR
jgi:hypothetical protein